MPKKRKPVILVADDDRSHRLMLTTLLEEWGYKTLEAKNGREAVTISEKYPVDLVLMDMRMPELDGIEATKQITKTNPALPVIVITAYSSIPTAVEAIKSGAYDYVTKPLDFDALKITLERSLSHVKLLQENEELKRQLNRLKIHDMIGKSPAMQQLQETIALVAPSEATVLITGESGTGKSLVARAIHANSDRKDKRLVEVNCAAIPENLIEAELFGYEKGAFTGANKTRHGRFYHANGGTIFLDEIGELNLLMQTKLLKVLQDKEIQRVGSDTTIPVDARVIAATNRNLEKMVAEGTFREDLYYRINVVRINVPSLRERKEDIPQLAMHFLKKYTKKNKRKIKGFTPEATKLLTSYSWPGNVRELENAVERAVILSTGELIIKKNLGINIISPEEDKHRLENTKTTSGNFTTLEEMEKNLIFKTLEETGGNKSEAARRLGITRRTLKLKLKKYFDK